MTGHQYDKMSAMYKFIIDETSQGNTVLAYNLKTVGGRTYKLNADNIETLASMIDGVLYIDGHCAVQWTVARKP